MKLKKRHISIMRRIRIISLLFIFICVCFSLAGQDEKVKMVAQDSTTIRRKEIDKKVVSQPGDTIGSNKTDAITVSKSESLPLLPEDEFKPSSKKAVIYSAIFPGLGQFYNRKYWKLPIIYGGFLGLVYAISWNGGKYNDYSDAYKDIMAGGNAWKSMLPGRDDQTLDSQKDRYKSMFKNNRDSFRRNRDLAIICTVGVYVLCMIDAYVDAELYNFDISPDISMNVVPAFWGPNAYSKGSIGIQCNIIF